MKLISKIVVLKSGEATSTESELSAEYVDVLLLSYDSSGAALKLHESNEALQSDFFTATRIKRHQVRFFNFLSMLLAQLFFTYFLYADSTVNLFYFFIFLLIYLQSLNYSDKSALSKPNVAYRIHADFWKSLYFACCGSSPTLPMIDLSGGWITSLVAAVNLGVPYLYLESYVLRLTTFIDAQFKPICSLVGSNCELDEIITFCSNMSKFIKDSKEIGILFSL